jgi:Na+/H+ antiporter NhaD/arsenite permease-like protein
VTDFIWPIISIAILALIILIGVLLFWKTRAMLKERKSGFPLKDERTQKLNGKAAYYAMFICQYFILAYVWVTFVGREFFGMPEIEAGYPMIATLLVSALSFLALRAYFGRKGEP